MRIGKALLLPLLVASQVAFAHDTACEILLNSSKVITLRVLREMSRTRLQKVEEVAARPQFDNLEVESKNEQSGEPGPQALHQDLSFRAAFVSSPEPTSPDVATVGLMDEVRSFPVHVDVNWHGQRTSSTVFASLPLALKGGEYLVGPEYPAVLVHLHGGGTPSATGKNGVNIGEKLMGRNIPVLSPTLPGHGRATRNPDHLLSFQEQADWLLALIDQLVDPRVKVILSGHSWGGMFAVFMHRLSADPKYARISHYISLSPGVDTSMGGTAAERVAFDQWWEKNFPKFKDRIAPADFEFQENVLSNGKEADIPSYFTGLTSLDYSTPPLTPDVMKNLKPLTVVVGTADGVVYVGREAQFEKVFGQLSGDSQLILLGPGRTWKSKTETDLQPTGHNIFDRYIDGTTTPQVYSLVGDIVQKEAGREFSAHAQDRASDLVDHYVRHYANFFAFRELVEQQVEYVTVPTPYLSEISARKVAIDDYFRKVEDRRSKAKKLADERATSALAKLREEVGLTDNMNLERAKAELTWGELTPERQAELEAFMQAVDKIDVDLRANFKDPQTDADMAKLTKEFAKVLANAGITKVEDYLPVYNRLLAKVENKDEERMRGDLGRCHQKYAQIQKSKQNRFGVERDRRLAALSLPKGVTDFRSAARELKADRSPERRAALEKFVARAADVEAQARADVAAEIEAAVQALPMPEGVNSFEDALIFQREVDERLTSTYVPPGAPENIRLTARKLKELEGKVETLTKGTIEEPSLEKLESTVRELRAKRTGLYKRWEALWDKGDLQSERLNQAKASYESTLASFKEIYFAYEAMKSAWLIQLRDEGRLTTQTLLAQTPELISARRRYQHAKKVFLEARETLDKVRREEAEAGSLEGPAESVKAVTKLASEMTPLNELLRAREDHFENRRQRLSFIFRQIEEQKYLYSQAMVAAGQSVPYTYDRYVIYQALDRPLNELLNDMRGNKTLLEALTKTMSRWEAYLTELRRDYAAHGKVDGSGY